MPDNDIRLSRAHEAWLYAVSALLVATGLLWLAFHYLVRVEGEFGPVAHPLQSWWLKLHGAASFAWLFLLGSVALWHSWRAWRSRRNRLTGGIFAALNLLLAVTGYLLYYAGGEQLRGNASVTHWAAGIAFAAVLVWHVWSARFIRSGV
jgi:hypothetical protein